MSARQVTDTDALVYVRLLDEGADVWRPVSATALPDGTFQLAEPDGYDSEAEVRQISSMHASRESEMCIEEICRWRGRARRCRLCRVAPIEVLSLARRSHRVSVRRERS